MTLEDAIDQARHTDARRKSVGYDQEALDAAARLGFGNAAFETTEDEVPEILEEFFPEDGSVNAGLKVGVDPSTTMTTGRPSLKEKLDDRAADIRQEPAMVVSVA